MEVPSPRLLMFAAVMWVAGRGVLRRRRAEAEFVRMFRLAPDLLAIVGLDGYCRRVNPAFQEALGYPLQELLATPIETLFHADDRARVREAIGRLAAGRQLVEFEARVISADGASHRLQSNARPVPGEGVFYVASRDVTDRRRTERELESLALEHAALRRVAMLVAQGIPPAKVLEAVTREARRLLGASSTRLFRYDGADLATVVAGADADGGGTLRTQVPLAGDTLPAVVWRTSSTAQRAGGDHFAAAAPISVEGRLWGVLVAGWQAGDAPGDSGIEARLSAFTELAATAVANASARAELVASRARIVAAGDEARRRIERNLHDGTQQQLIALGLDLQRVRAAVPEDDETVRSGLEDVEHGIESVLEDIRELSRGLHPGLLARNGLGPSLRSLARRSPIPATVDVDLPARPPASIETAVYYVVSEALTNAIKHSRASSVAIGVVAEDGGLHATIADDGVGGAEPGEGSGLTGAADRVDALGGRLLLDSRRGQGTTIRVELPLAGDAPGGLNR